MKSKLKALSWVLSVFLFFGIPCLALAGNATQVDVKISYPYGQTNAIARATGGDVVNIYITLLDEEGNPATAGPGGEDLDGLTASISSNLGQTGAIDEDEEFLVDVGTVEFDVPDGVGPVSRAYVDYTGATPGIDTVTVSFPTYPEVYSSAQVNVIAPPAEALRVRTYGTSSPSLTLFGDIDGQQYNNGNPAEAGSEVDFWVIADDGNGKYTYAPELDGLEVTVKAYGDFSADGNNIGLDTGSDGVNHEVSSIAEATATFSNGIAQGTITIDNGGPGSYLDVVLTAVCAPAGTTIDVGTTEMVAGVGIDSADGGANIPSADTDVDYVPMRSGGASQLIIGEDLYNNGNLIQEKDCYIVHDDGTTAKYTDITVILADSLGNAVKAYVDKVVDGALGSYLDGYIVDKSGSSPAAGTHIWDIAKDDYEKTDYLSDEPGTANNKAPLDDSFSLSSAGLEGDDTNIFLVPSAGAGTLDLTVDTDADGISIDAGSTVTMNITAKNNTLAVEEGDSLQITAQGAGKAQLLSKNGFSSATEQLLITADDEDPNTSGMQISFTIYGPCTPATDEPVTVTMTNLSKCEMSASNSTTNIKDIKPDDADHIAIRDMLVNYSGELTDDPIVVTEEIVAGTETYLIAGDGTTDNDLQTVDQYENTTDKVPDFNCTSQLGVLDVDPDDSDSDGKILSVTYPTSAVGQTDTIECSVTGIAESRHFEIGNIVSAATTPDATALEVLQEGPQDVDGNLICATPGGEAIIRIGANGDSTGDDREVKVSLSGITDAELRDLDGTSHTGTVTLLDSDDYKDKRLVVSAPAAGDLTITASDQSDTPLDTGILVLCFGEAVSCTVTIDPDEASVAINQTRQFTASTVCDGQSVTGDYTWEIMDQGCTGTSIDADTGVYTAGSIGDCTDTIKVTDTANRNVSTTATVNVIECVPEVTVTCDDSEVAFGETTQCTATTECDTTTITEDYTWSVTSDVGSSIDQNGLYTAGSEEGTDTVKATGKSTGEEGTAEIDVISPESIDVIRESVPRSRWIVLPAFIMIEGEGTSFATPTVTYTSALSPLSVIPLPPLVFRATQQIWQIILVMPSLISGVWDTETITVTVDGLTDTFDINLLPVFLDEKRHLK